jgi:hypothetical protein
MADVIVDPAVPVLPVPPLPPTTTHQEDLTTAGQRSINLIWEWTQAIISVVVVIANMIVAVFDGLNPTHSEYPTILSSSLFLIIGFYFSRTNHAAIGGIGSKPAIKYEGR